jgi:hypothetical protein
VAAIFDCLTQSPTFRNIAVTGHFLARFLIRIYGLRNCDTELNTDLHCGAQFGGIVRFFWQKYGFADSALFAFSRSLFAFLSSLQ